MKTNLSTLATGATLGLLALGTQTASAQPSIDWYKVAGGGVSAANGGTLEMYGTTGQHDAGTMGGDTIVLFGGFWAPEIFEPVPCPADYNKDGGVDSSDVEAFFTDWEAGSSFADVNFDGGVDAADVQFFFEAWEAGGC
ncbi:MAG: GC-type dockerin domain-anchored protein [Phycisphaerae bacterium]